MEPKDAVCPPKKKARGLGASLKSSPRDGRAPPGAAFATGSPINPSLLEAEAVEAKRREYESATVGSSSTILTDSAQMSRLSLSLLTPLPPSVALFNDHHPITGT